LLHLFPYATGVGIDISADAIDCARQNSEQLNLSEKIDFRVQSWEEPFSEQFDLVVTNPPTIPTSALSCLPPEMGKYNPRISLDGGEDGMDFFRKMDFVLAPLLKNTGRGIFQAFSVEREASFFSQKTYKTRPLFSYRGDPCALSVSLI
jgi:release factor glutamine methyltransferase